MNALAKTENTDLAQHVDLPVDIAWPDLQAAISGNLAKLTAEGQVKYYNALCKFTGLNPLGFPFEWITFQGKLKLYPKKECADQLRGVHKISATIIERTFFDDICMVRVMSTTPDGRKFESTGAVPYTKNMPALDRCKAIKVAETQAYRRGTFGLVGLGNLSDEDTDDTQRPHVVVDTAGEESVSTRAEKLNQLLAEPKVIELLQEPTPGKPAEVQPPIAATAPVQVVPETAPVTGEANTDKSVRNTSQSPDDFSFEDANPPALALTPEQKMAMELETVFAENRDCIAYLIRKDMLKSGAPLETMDPRKAKKILERSQDFLRAVDAWVKGGRK